ncbi:MAG: SEC-C metal-binding domain-containing protein [Gemmatimonadota bacterium]
MTDGVSRNGPCPCGSGRKYKNCCYAKDRRMAALAPYYAARARGRARAAHALRPRSGSRTQSRGGAAALLGDRR